MLLSGERHPGVYRVPVPSPQCPLGFFLLSLRRDLEQWGRALRDARLGDLHLDDVLAARQLEHDVHEDLFENRAKPSCTRAAAKRLLRDRAKRTLFEADLHFFELEQLGVLLGERVLGLLEDADERIFVERLERNAYWQAANKLGNQAITQQIIRLDFREWVLRDLFGLAALHLFLREANLLSADT